MTNTMKSLLALCLFCGAGAVSTAETPVRHTAAHLFCRTGLLPLLRCHG